MPFKRKRDENSDVLPVGEPPDAAPGEDVPLSPPDRAASEQPRPSDPIPDQLDGEPEEGYDLAEPPPAPTPRPSEPAAAPPVAEGPAADPEPAAAKKAKHSAAKPKPKPAKPRATQLWSQGGELGRLLIVPLALVVLGIIIICTPWTHVLVGVITSLAGLAMLGYLVAVSLDRPVRVTPEQGVREYFEALDHHLPNFRRMYLLLTDDARQVPELSTYRRFHAYWTYRLALLRPPEAGLRPMVAKIRKFKAEYNRNRTWARTSYILEFHVRGLEGESAASFEMNGELVKAADGMWYLNEGRIPEPDARG